MAAEQRSKEAEEILDTLHSLSLETEEEIIGMPREQVQARLKEEGINLDAKRLEMRQRLDAIRRQRTLKEARERRLAADAALTQRPAAAEHEMLSFDQVRSEVSRRLSQMPSTGPAVQAYFNRFRTADDEDLAGLLDDLRLLDEMNQENEDHG